MNIKEILEKIGYNLRDDGNFWRSPSIYRGGDNPSSLRISKENGSFVDFPVNVSGSFKDLLKLSMKDKNIKEIEGLIKSDLSDLKTSLNKTDKLLVKNKINTKELGTLVCNYNFYNKRGISDEVQKELNLRVCMSGKMCRRVVFPVYDRNLNVIGVSGRSIFPENPIKWKHLGFKRDWCYPLHITEKYIKEKKEVILVESIGDTLALFNAGIKNVISLCGIKLLKGVKQEIVRLSPLKVVISTNNEPDNKSRGNNAAKEILRDLSVFIDVDKLQIKLPPRKDFGECSKEEIINWYNN